MDILESPIYSYLENTRAGKTVTMYGERNLRIRQAVPGDASAIAAVLYESFLEYRASYTREGFAATTPGRDQILLRMQEGPVWVAVLARDVVGTASAVVKPGGLYVRGMAVLPVARCRRVGELLLEEIARFAGEHNCRRLFLSTTPFLERAIRLYERFGFRRIDEGPHHLFGTPLFMMEKVISK